MYASIVKRYRFFRSGGCRSHGKDLDDFGCAHALISIAVHYYVELFAGSVTFFKVKPFCAVLAGNRNDRWTL